MTTKNNAAGVPETTSAQIRLIANCGNKQLIDDVAAGRVSIKDAAKGLAAAPAPTGAERSS